MQFRLSIITISLAGLLSIAPITKAAVEWEYSEGTVLEPVFEATCPCFGPTNGLMFANTRKAGSTVDIHRPSSCIMNNAAISIDYVPLDAARTKFDGIPYSGMIDGVYYNYLTATFDRVNEIYECGEEDIRRVISAAEAETCYNLLSNACVTLKENICPCYSVQDLIQVERGVVNKKVEIYGEETCMMSETDTQFSTYGVFKKSNTSPIGAACEKCGITKIGIQQNGDCFDGSDIIQNTTVGQAIHCRNIMADSCAVLNVSKAAVVTDTASCADDATFIQKGRASRNCATWVAADPSRRCKKLVDDQSDKRVFEFCRETCGYCACKDKSDANCCKDDPKFRYWNLPDLDCVWASGRGSTNNEKKRVARCKLTAVASSCPETCGMCPAQ